MFDHLIGRSLSIYKNKFLGVSISYAIVFLVLTIVCKLTLFQGSYSNDPHHWGLMMSNAIDMTKGLKPYKEIFLQYGILTPAIQALSLVVFGETLQSIILITAISYCIGLLGIFQLAFELTQSRRLALYSFLSIALLHEIVIYPWANYVAFPFLVYGLLFLVKHWKDGSGYNALTSGLLLSLAILCRENLFMPILSLAICVSILSLFRNRIGHFKKINYLQFWIGLAFPLLLFFLVLWAHKLLPYWYIDSILLPRAYIQRFMGNGIWDSLLQLFRFFDHGFKIRDVRLIFLALTIFTASWVCIAVCLNIGSLRSRWDCFFTALFSLLLLSASLHINEHFRLATGAAIGIPLVYLVGHRLKIADLVFIIFAAFASHSFIFHPGNNGYPSVDYMYTTVSSNKPSFFASQRWPLKTFTFYSNVEDDLKSIYQKNCNVSFYINNTQDVFLAILSPFTLYQIAPFGKNFDGGVTTQFDNLRDDFKIDEKIDSHRLVILTQKLKEASYKAPENYLIFSRYDFPESYFMPSGNELLIIAPKKCKTSTDSH